MRSQTDVVVIRHADYQTRNNCHPLLSPGNLTQHGQISSIELAQSLSSFGYDSINVIGYGPTQRKDRIPQTTGMIATTLQQEPIIIDSKNRIENETLIEGNTALFEAIKKVTKNEAGKKSLVLVILSLDDILDTHGSLSLGLFGDYKFYNDSKPWNLMENWNKIDNLNGFTLSIEDGAYVEGSAQLPTGFLTDTHEVDKDLQQSISEYHSSHETTFSCYRDLQSHCKKVLTMIQTIKDNIKTIREEDKADYKQTLDNYNDRLVNRLAVQKEIEAPLEDVIDLLNHRFYTASKGIFDEAKNTLNTKNHALVAAIYSAESKIDGLKSFLQETESFITNKGLGDLPF